MSVLARSRSARRSSRVIAILGFRPRSHFPTAVAHPLALSHLSHFHREDDELSRACPPLRALDSFFYPPDAGVGAQFPPRRGSPPRGAAGVAAPDRNRARDAGDPPRSAGGDRDAAVSRLPGHRSKGPRPVSARAGGRLRSRRQGHGRRCRRGGGSAACGGGGEHRHRRGPTLSRQRHCRASLAARLRGVGGGDGRVPFLHDDHPRGGRRRHRGGARARRRHRACRHRHADPRHRRGPEASRRGRLSDRRPGGGPRRRDRRRGAGGADLKETGLEAERLRARDRRPTQAAREQPAEKRIEGGAGCELRARRRERSPLRWASPRPSSPTAARTMSRPPRGDHPAGQPPSPPPYRAGSLQSSRNVGAVLHGARLDGAGGRPQVADAPKLAGGRGPTRRA